MLRNFHPNRGSFSQGSTLPSQENTDKYLLTSINPLKRVNRGHAKSQNPLVIQAVSELDNLVCDLIKKSHGIAPRGFLEWIADEVTPLVEKRALKLAERELAVDDRMQVLVLQWVGQLIMCFSPQLVPAVIQVACQKWQANARDQLSQGMTVDCQLS